MRSKGCNGATTIHSLIYKARDNGEETPSFELWHEAPASKAKLIVVDECSMVDAELAHDLMSFQVPLLVLGDPTQLPPIQGGEDLQEVPILRDTAVAVSNPWPIIGRWRGCRALAATWGPGPEMLRHDSLRRPCLTLTSSRPFPRVREAGRFPSADRSAAVRPTNRRRQALSS